MNRKLKMIAATLMVLSCNCYAKSQSGIYMSAADYQQNRLTYESGQQQVTQIHVHDFLWSSPTVTVKEGDKKYTLKKSAIYGFKDSHDHVYRFYNNTEYRIDEAGTVYIYSKPESIAACKTHCVINVLYFSKAADSAIIPLTFSNLKSAFAGNEKYTQLLYEYFSEGGVCAYDDIHKCFKVNYVLSKK